ncbi:MAG TPA: MFS transporter [Rhizomicrobium sp.]|jgi:PAT family beta-lactamase induction signal transducer AmpG|nr:MFS transporter [Rhizomicrobium sp.]
MTVPSRVRAPLGDYFKPRTLVMFALGFSSGLPFLLTGNTFGYWLRDEGTSLTAIGFISWVGLAYSLKFLWAPVIDRVAPPLLGRLGRRRGWMLLSQVVVGVGLFLMAVEGRRDNLILLGAFALAVAFASATQDIVIDAWRIETAENHEQLALLTSAYQLGYRIAFLATDALILISAEHLGWRPSYIACALAMLVGVVATLVASEPAKADRVIDSKTAQSPLWSARGFLDAVWGPFLVFVRTYGWVALLMLAAISLYRLPDFLRGPITNPFYHDIGLSKDYVGAVRGTVGVAAVFLGIAAGGACALRFGYMRALIAGGVLQALGIAAFALLAARNPNPALFAAVMVGDNFSISFAGVALVAYMSSLTSLGYTATQYALLSSAYTWPGKVLKGSVGFVIEGMAAHEGLMPAYQVFFVGAALLGIPAIVLFMALAAQQRAPGPATSNA